MQKPVAAALIKNKIVSVATWLSDYSNIKRLDIRKIGSF